VNRQLSLAVRERAASRSEYCGPPQSAYPLPFQIDHVLAEKHGGETIESNLALACTHCNRHKGPNIAGVDAASGQLVRLFNPRSDSWTEHFEPDGPHLRGKTAIGRTTVNVLAMNDEDQLRVRSALLKED
jgi:HNH endonuclease